MPIGRQQWPIEKEPVGQSLRARLKLCRQKNNYAFLSLLPQLLPKRTLGRSMRVAAKLSWRVVIARSRKSP
jgi:hypothetical protein